MTTKTSLLVLAMCFAGGIAPAQPIEAPTGVHVGPYQANGTPKIITFGDTGCPGCVAIGENVSDDTLELNASRFHFKYGRIGIGHNDPQGKVDIQAGGGYDGVGDQKALAFSWNSGGYRHWVRTRHNATLGMGFGNAIDFYVNASSTAAGSSGPGSGSILAMTMDSGRVGIGTLNPVRALHAEGSEIHSGGNAGGFSFANRNTGTFVDVPAAGERWVWYAEGGAAHLWSGGNKVTVNPNGNMTVQGQLSSQTLLLTSDRNAKGEFLAVDNQEVLRKLVALPLSTWSYTNTPAVRHLGPMAQDFKAAFNLGSDDKHIATVDADGVALAAIQALHEMVQEKNSEIAALRRQVSALQTELAGVKDTVTDRLAALEKAMAKDVANASAAAAGVVEAAR